MTKIFVDAADFDEVISLSKKEYISGITTNPTLMRKSGVSNFEIFAKAVIASTTLPLSLEVFSDEIDEMYEQALKISKWGDQVYIKIPITNTKGQSTCELIKNLTKLKIKINITAILSKKQIDKAINALDPDVNSIISIFAGRIADTGLNPNDFILYAINKKEHLKKCEVLWASTREIYNLYEAINIGCDIITIPPSLLKKISMKDMDLEELSLDTIKMFYNDALETGYKI
tara:strand:+ start:715 stop:1407 length:693 start_codon:yes stop_codon:yes gene_type:complete